MTLFLILPNTYYYWYYQVPGLVEQTIRTVPWYWYQVEYLVVPGTWY